MTGRKQTEQVESFLDAQIRRVNPTYLPAQLAPDEVECPVCHHPAVRRAADGLTPPVHYDHEFRLFPCRSDWVALSLEETRDARIRLS